MSIDPERLYAFSEAARIIPGPYGKPICLRTLHRWRLLGLFNAEARQIGRGRFWFVKGSEIELLMRPAIVAAPRARVSGSARRRQLERCEQQLAAIYGAAARG